MKKTYVYTINIILLCLSCLTEHAEGQDTLMIPLKIKVGIEVSGPVTYFIEKKNFSAEGYFSYDLDEKKAIVLNAGFLNYSFSQYNYSYLNKGMFLRAGIDFNLLKPEKAMGKYWAGLGLRYGLSVFTYEVPTLKQENYWGIRTATIPKQTRWGHFLEVSPGVRTEIFKNFSMGWTVSLRMLVYTGTGKDLRPIYFPGFGNGAKRVSTGINYFMVWNIPYKKIRVIIKKEEPEEPEEPGSATQGIKPGTIRQ